MTEKKSSVKTITTVAPLTNVKLCMAALERAMNRDRHLPGLVCFYGPSGWGKSSAASYAYNKMGAYYVECRSTFTKKAFLQEVLKEMGLPPHKTIHEMFNQVIECLGDGDTPLIIDEMDYLVDKNAVELVRDLFEGSQAPVLLIGEETLPDKLKQWERFHGRILEWVPAQRINLGDAAHLQKLYCPDLDVAEDLLIRIHDLSNGSARRVCVNLARVQEEARRDGVKTMNLASWAGRRLYTGEPPKRRER